MFHNKEAFKGREFQKHVTFQAFCHLDRQKNQKAQIVSKTSCKLSYVHQDFGTHAHTQQTD